MIHYTQELSIYLEAVESIRKEKGISIDSFIDSITSERSYRRYLNQELSIPLDVLEKLISKLDVQIADILFYVLKIKQKPSGIIEYFTYVHYDEHDHSKPYYESLKTYHSDTVLLNTLVYMYVSYDEYRRNIISFNDLTSILNAHQPIFDVSIPTIESLSFYVLYAFISNDLTHHASIMIGLLEKQFYMSQILLFDIIIDQYLIVLSRFEHLSQDYITLSQLYFQVAHMWQDAYFMYSAQIHRAYQKFLTQDDTYTIDLLKHLFYARMLLSKEPTMYQHIIEKMTNLPIETYVKKALLEVIA
jgi:hypothetical protein